MEIFSLVLHYNFHAKTRSTRFLQIPTHPHHLYNHQHYLDRAKILNYGSSKHRNDPPSKSATDSTSQSKHTTDSIQPKLSQMRRDRWARNMLWIERREWEMQKREIEREIWSDRSKRTFGEQKGLAKFRVTIYTNPKAMFSTRDYRKNLKPRLKNVAPSQTKVAFCTCSFRLKEWYLNKA